MKATTICLLMLTLLLLACSPEPAKVETRDTRTRIDLEVVLFDTEKELNSYINKNFNTTPHTRGGFSMWYTDGTDCTIYLVKAKPNYGSSRIPILMENLMPVYGHEIMHCIYGSYHTE